MKNHIWARYTDKKDRCARKHCPVTRRIAHVRGGFEYKAPQLEWTRYRPPCLGDSTAN
jgi:hypothetical protein